MSMNSLRFQWLSFLSALGLMSRIPVSPLLKGQELATEHHRYSQIWYPWVGAVLAAFLLLWLWIAPDAWSALLSAVILLIIWVLFSGALHLDGFADSVDAWVGGMGDSQKTLTIMKDPTSGPMAVVAVVLLLLLKLALLVELISMAGGFACALLPLVPVLSRVWLLPLLYATPYARKSQLDAQSVQTSESMGQQGGMADNIASGFPLNAAVLSFIACQLGLLIFSWNLWVLLALNATAFALFILIRNACLNRIAGYTGDVLGAFIELQEVALLLALVVMAVVLY